MSDYRKEKVLRIPLSDLDLTELNQEAKVYAETHGYYCDCNLKDIFDLVLPFWGYCDKGKFQFSPTVTEYVDYVLAVDDGYDDYGKVRDLYSSEKELFLPEFKKIDKNINMDKVRLVEFCWYDGVEAPDYYDYIDDDFYTAITHI